MNNSYESLSNEGQFSQLNVGTALASSVTLTDISPGANVVGEAYTWPAGYLQIGQAYRIEAHGIISNTGTPTLLLGLYYGGVAGTALAATTALTTVASLSNSYWELKAKLRVDAVGTSGSIRAMGTIFGPYSATGLVGLPASSSSGNNVTVDTGTAAKILTIGAQWGTSSASNSIQVTQFTVERLNEGSS